MDLKVVAINSQGFFKEEINRLISSHRVKPDVLVVTEHKRRKLNNIRDSINDYTLATGYPASTGQRGSAVFVRDGVEHKVRHDLNRHSSEEVFESASVEVKSKGENVVVTGLYRSPNSSKAEFNERLDNFARLTKKGENTRHVIAGDLNIDLTKDNTTNDVLSEHDLRYHIRSATHDGGRCLDNFITSKDAGCSGRRLNSSFSDHRPIQLSVPISVPTTSRTSKRPSSIDRSSSSSSGFPRRYISPCFIPERPSSSGFPERASSSGFPESSSSPCFPRRFISPCFIPERPSSSGFPESSSSPVFPRSFISPSFIPERPSSSGFPERSSSSGFPERSSSPGFPRRFISPRFIPERPSLSGFPELLSSSSGFPERSSSPGFPRLFISPCFIPERPSSQGSLEGSFSRKRQRSPSPIQRLTKIVRLKF